MPKRQLMLNLDDGLLKRAEHIAEQQGRSLRDLLVEHLHHMVKADKKRRYRREIFRPLVDRPTQPLRDFQVTKAGVSKKKPVE